MAGHHLQRRTVGAFLFVEVDGVDRQVEHLETVARHGFPVALGLACSDRPDGAGRRQGASPAAEDTVMGEIALELGDETGMKAGLRVEAFRQRSEEHTSELQSLMRISYAVFCLKKKKRQKIINEQNS